VSRSSRAAFMASSSRWRRRTGRSVGSCQASPSGGKSDVQDALGERVGALGLSRGLQRPPNGAPRRRTGRKSPASARARAAVCGGSGSGFPSSTCVFCSVTALSSPMGYGDAGASLVGWHFVLVGPDLIINGARTVSQPRGGACPLRPGGLDRSAQPVRRTDP